MILSHLAQAGDPRRRHGEDAGVADRPRPPDRGRDLAQRRRDPGRRRITSYNVCYTKLLRGIPDIGQLLSLMIFLRQVRLLMK